MSLFQIVLGAAVAACTVLALVMPPEIVTGSDAADVAAFVARVAGR